MSSQSDDIDGASPQPWAPFQLLARHRRWVLPGLDSAAWAIGLAFGAWVRYDLRIDRIELGPVLGFALLAIVLQLSTGFLLGLYAGRYRFGSFEEVVDLALTVGATTGVLFAVDIVVQPRMIPLSATLGGGVAALVLIGGIRYLWRLYLERLARPSVEGRTRLLVFGAGEAGYQVIAAMLRDQVSPYVPVALLDDDWSKRRLQIMGVRVEGSRADITAVAKHYRADELLIAIPGAGRELIGELTDLAADAGLKVKVLPPVAELFGAGVSVRDIRPVAVKDLLGRREIDTDIESIAGYLTGKRVLVTGAGGSIGSELCRQIFRFAPDELVMLDRDESALQNVQLSIDGKGLLDSGDLVLADIRDRTRLEEVFADRRPEVVFHAAALKHLPLLERHPAEALQTNILATLSLLEISAAAGIERFVNISTDKAADPSSVLGYSKRISERLTAHFATDTSGTYLSVRFGNVLGSRGSMLETFNAQIAAGGPLTVTDPEVTRFFMTVEEAVQLVIQAGAIGRDGEALVLDMGSPVSIAGVAQRLIGQADRSIEIVFTGLRPGEKLHEALLSVDEVDARPIHDLISHVPVPPLRPVELDVLSHRLSRTELADRMSRLCRDSRESATDRSRR